MCRLPPKRLQSQDWLVLQALQRFSTQPQAEWATQPPCQRVHHSRTCLCNGPYGPNATPPLDSRVMSSGTTPPSDSFRAIWLNINGINSNKTNSSFYLEPYQDYWLRDKNGFNFWHGRRCWFPMIGGGLLPPWGLAVGQMAARGPLWRCPLCTRKRAFWGNIYFSNR